jgi:gluconolactonase
MLDLAAVRTLVGGLDHPEGIALGPDGLLYAGGEAGQIYQIDPGTGACEQIASTGGFVLGLCLDAAGRVYACDSERQAVLRIDPATGDVAVYCDATGGRRLRAPNWPVFEPDGTLWVSDSGTDDATAPPDGTLLRIGPAGGEGETLDASPFWFPNGLALGTDGTLFVVESFAPRISTVRAGRVEHYVELPHTVPDGLALDAEGALMVLCYQPNRVLRVPPGGGKPQLVLDDWAGARLPTPTNAAFFGDGLTQLAIAALGGWSVQAVDTPWNGQPLHYPALP